MDSATMQRLAFDHPAIEASSQLDAMIRANLMAEVLVCHLARPRGAVGLAPADRSTARSLID